MSVVWVYLTPNSDGTHGLVGVYATEDRAWQQAELRDDPRPYIERMEIEA